VENYGILYGVEAGNVWSSCEVAKDNLLMCTVGSKLVQRQLNSFCTSPKIIRYPCWKTNLAIGNLCSSGKKCFCCFFSWDSNSDTPCILLRCNCDVFSLNDVTLCNRSWYLCFIYSGILRLDKLSYNCSSFSANLLSCQIQTCP